MLITGILGANFAVRGAVRLSAGIRKETFKKIQTYSFSNIDESIRLSIATTNPTPAMAKMVSYFFWQWKNGNGTYPHPAV